MLVSLLHLLQYIYVCISWFCFRLSHISSLNFYTHHQSENSWTYLSPQTTKNKTEKISNIHNCFCIVPSFLLNSPFCHTNYSPVVYNVFSFAGKEASFPGS